MLCYVDSIVEYRQPAILLFYVLSLNYDSIGGFWVGGKGKENTTMHHILTGLRPENCIIG